MVELNNDGEIEGKVLYLEVRDVPVERQSVLLSNARFKTIFGKVFITGSVPREAYFGWVAGRNAGVSWSDVLHFLVFDSIEDYNAAAASHERASSGASRFFGRK